MAAPSTRKQRTEAHCSSGTGGHEFCIFFIGVGSTPQIKAIAERLCKAMCSLYVPEQQGMPETSCSVGIATCKGQSKDFEMLYG